MEVVAQANCHLTPPFLQVNEFAAWRHDQLSRQGRAEEALATALFGQQTVPWCQGVGVGVGVLQV